MGFLAYELLVRLVVGAKRFALVVALSLALRRNEDDLRLFGDLLDLLFYHTPERREGTGFCPFAR